MGEEDAVLGNSTYSTSVRCVSGNGELWRIKLSDLMLKLKEKGNKMSKFLEKAVVKKIVS